MLTLPFNRTFQDIQQPVMAVLQKVLQYDYNVRFHPTDTEIALFVCYTAVIAVISYVAVRDVRNAKKELEDREDVLETVVDRFVENLKKFREDCREEIATLEKKTKVQNARIRLLTARLTQKETESRKIKESVIDNLIPVINSLDRNDKLTQILTDIARKYEFGTIRLVISEDNPSQEQERCECSHEMICDSEVSSSSDDSSDSDYVPPSTQKRRRT
jgi:hypothetical protein